MTQSDESIDEMMVNSESWSSQSDEPHEIKGHVILLKAWAPPRESDHTKDKKQRGDEVTSDFEFDEETGELKVSDVMRRK